MTLQEAQDFAKQLGDIPVSSEKLPEEIQRLNRKGFVLLEQVQILHDWLEGKHQPIATVPLKQLSLLS